MEGGYAIIEAVEKLAGDIARDGTEFASIRHLIQTSLANQAKILGVLASMKKQIQNLQQ